MDEFSGSCVNFKKGEEMRYGVFSIQFVLFNLFFVCTTSSVELLIDKPGLYKLGNTITTLPSAADSAINITVGNVILDLGGRTILQGNGTALVDGVLINNGLSDIIIRNGTISGFTRSGIRVGSSCSKIEIENISFINCAISGLDFQGTALNTIVDGSVRNAQIYNCGTTSGGAPLNMLFCSNFTVSGCAVSNTVATIALTAALLDNLSQCSFDTLLIKSNVTTNALTGISVIGGSSNSFTNCLVQSNSGTTGLTGISLTSATASNSLINCSVIGNTSITGIFTGFNLNSAPSSYLNNCTANANTGVGARGFVFDGGSNSAAVLGCTANANSNTGGGSSCVGFSILSASSGLLLDCISSYNTSALTCQGIAFGGITPGSTWVLRAPVTERNVGNTAGNSFGFVYSALAPLPPSGSFFFRTIAFSNNTTAGNQISAPASYNGSITSVAGVLTSNLNSITGVWTNIAVPS